MAGLEVASVNGTPMAEFLRAILDRCSGEKPEFRAAVFLWNEPFWYNLTNLFGRSSSYKLQLRDMNGKSREATLETLSYADYMAFRNPGGAEPLRPNTRGTAVEFFDSGATAHFLYSHFRPGAEEKKRSMPFSPK